MRGKLGNKLTILGDQLYDWVKLYQSLIWYDEILENVIVIIDNEYKLKMINYFEEYFVKLFSRDDLKNIKLITKSLLFSLIPLHDNEKCADYYNLIQCKFLNI